MDIELLEIRDFLADHPPFDLLPKQVLEQTVATLEISYYRKGEEIIKPGDHCTHWYVVRSGAVEITSAKDTIVARQGEGEIFGHRALLRGGMVANRYQAIEDSLIYRLEAETFNRLLEQHPNFSWFFGATISEKMHDAANRSTPTHEGASMGFFSTAVKDLLSRDAVSMDAGKSVKAVAQRMVAEGVSCMLLTKKGNLVGILTDRDLRSRVIAAGLPLDTSAKQVMTKKIHTMTADQWGLDAIMTMTRNNIHHIPVIDNKKPLGVLTFTNLNQAQSTSCVHMVGEISKYRTIPELCQVTQRIPKLIGQLVHSGSSADGIGHLVTAVGDSITHRLLQLAEEKFGKPPIPFVWLASGSQARQEQSALSDQDNCLLLDDGYCEDRHGEYFAALTKFVCDGLDKVGYSYCPGKMMANNPQWRLSLKMWRKTFNGWIRSPDPKSLMFTCIFFDLRPIYGETALFDDLWDFVRRKGQKNRIYLAHMAANAVTRHPPLGFFRNFVLIRGGIHKHTLDLKHNGVIPIVDLARIYALDAGLEAVNTQERLEAAPHAGTLSRSGSHDLADALEFIALTRLRHQARRIAAGEVADNFMAPDELSRFERASLKDAFNIVQTMQASLEQRFQLSRFR
ncbi:MAG: cyclic nucleotide-binding/CBS domain-containing protein [Magnetococcales bacterium]|nr:cyclic nucleotide-binding/CBS domain-containing protein [Magnetococcales bacterium]